MKRFLLSLSLLLLVAVAANAQKQGTVTGKVVEATNQESMIAASVQLYSLPDSVFKVGVATDTKGGFSLKAAPGNYFARVSYLGYVAKDVKVKVSKGKTGN